MDLTKYDYLLKQNIHQQDPEKIPAGTYKAQITKIEVKESKTGNPIIITTFKVLNNFKTFSYIRTIPTKTTAKSSTTKTTTKTTKETTAETTTETKSSRTKNSATTIS